MVRFAAVACLLALSLGQDQSQPPPRFRSGVDIILLDVTVLDKHRRPVRGLTATDFTILEDGKAQQIVSFDELDAPEPDGSTVAWMREVAPDIRTNAAENRRIVLMILDDANISFHHTDRVKEIGRRIIDQLGRSDRASVIYTGNNARSQEFTNDRTALRRAVDRYADTLVPRMGDSNMPGQYAVQTVRRASQAMVALPHRRKAMIFVSSLAVNFANHNDDTGFQLQQALRTAQTANVSIYPINPAGLEVNIGAPAAPVGGRMLATSADAARDLAADTARVIADHTGGFAVTNSNTFDTQIGQIFRETGSYYLIGFQSGHRDGKFRRLEVRTTRPGVTVRTRNGYDAPKPEKEAKAEKAGAVPLPLVKSLSDVLPNPDMPVRVSVAPFAVAGRNAAALAIVLGVQQPAPQGDHRIVEKIELISTAHDTHSSPRGSYRQTVQLTLRAAEGTTDLDRGAHAGTVWRRSRGRSSLRAAARQPEPRCLPVAIHCRSREPHLVARGAIRRSMSGGGIDIIPIPSVSLEPP